MVDLWRDDGSEAGGYGAPARGWNSTCVSGPKMQGGGPCPAGCTPGPKGDQVWGGYEDALLEQAVISTIQDADVSAETGKPMFLFWAPHAVHAPLQVPAAVEAEFDFMQATDAPDHERQRMHAMVHFFDRALGNVTDALKAKGVWNESIVVMLGDNGGAISKGGNVGGNNWPLTGGKYNNWEGGIRTTSFVTGGYLPAERRGTTYEGLVAGWDWYVGREEGRRGEKRGAKEGEEPTLCGVWCVVCNVWCALCAV